MQNDITIVTAFFDIGREKFKKIPRTRSAYIQWFERWARIQNDLVVFCGDEDVKNEIVRMRTGYGLIDKTKIVVIDDVFAIENDMYRRMIAISKDKYFLDFRTIKNATSNIPEYNYINFLKSYFLQRAVKQEGAGTKFIAWLDFGFDHGGKLYPHEEDWNFLWRCECLEKVHLFYLPPRLEQRPIFEVIRTLLPDSIMGPVIICPASLAEKFWQINRESIYEMLDMGLMDDDQTVLLLSSRRNPDLFELKQSCWFLPVKEMGGGHMRVNNDFLYKKNVGLVHRFILKTWKTIKSKGFHK